MGDCIAGISLPLDVVHGLSKTNGARADYEELGRQLQNLSNGLECVKGLSLDTAQQTSAVDTTLNDCRLCIDSFVERSSNFKSLEVTFDK